MQTHQRSGSRRRPRPPQARRAASSQRDRPAEQWPWLGAARLRQRASVVTTGSGQESGTTSRTLFKTNQKQLTNAMKAQVHTLIQQIIPKHETKI